MDPKDPNSSQQNSGIAKVLEEQKNTLEETTKLLIRRDIELHKTNEELAQDKDTLAAERDKLQVVLSGVSDAVIALDLDRNIVAFNKAAEQMTGFIKEEALGKNISLVFQLYDETGVLSEDIYAPIKTDGTEGIFFQKQNLKLVPLLDQVNPKEIYINLIAGSIKGAAKINLGCILTLHDVTKERELEKMKLDFVSMAAHELRTPLTSIKGYVSIFMSENKAQLNPRQDELLSKASLAVQQLNTLIENMLNISNIEKNNMVINPIPSDWVAIVRQATNDFANAAAEKNISLTFLEPQSISPVKVDKAQIIKVLNNLLSNAISFTPRGGKVQVSIEQVGSEVVTHIQDTGLGIAVADLPHLFTKFFKIISPLEHYSKGTGMGLYISKSIIDLHHGKIWAESEPNKGSTFSFSLSLV